MVLPLLAAVLGLFAASKALRRADDCCTWEGGSLNPLAVMGVVYYLTLLAAIMLAPYAVTEALAAIGFLVSVFLTIVQSVTGRWCRWCLLSAAAATLAMIAL